MRVLGINTGHNGSAAYVVDGNVEFYIEEERLTRRKYDGFPIKGMLEAIENGVDVLIIGGTSPNNPTVGWTGEDMYESIVKKHNPEAIVINCGSDHHLGHVSNAFYNSGFKTAVAIVVDGAGSLKSMSINNGEQEVGRVEGFETESIIKCSYPAAFEPIYKSYANQPDKIFKHTEGPHHFDDAITITKAYEAVTNYLGFHFIEAGKTMGLAPYGQQDDTIPNLFLDGRGNKNVFVPGYPAGAFVDAARFQSLGLSRDPREWHHDPSKISDTEKNLAWKIQQDTQELVGDLIEKAHEMTDETNIVVSGGYGLNCVANYYYKKRFPDLNIYHDPMSHDGGTSLGLALAYYHDVNKIDKPREQLKTLYLGVTKPEYDFEQIEGITVSDTTAADVAKLIKERNIVTIFQGKSEGGPRALGNRSILYDPTDVNGKEHVNKVKGREWFRPFAGSMLQEHFEEWFETRGLEESPFMMYAMDFKSQKHGEVPAITHVDGTCRIQTVTEEQNKHYYDLINEFYKLTDIPVLFNTSFNLAGEPLVETLDDAIRTMKNSDMDYMYLPEVGKLVTVPRLVEGDLVDEDEEAA